jgi:short-subunit dehydrogenase involved in D-alanine esterification of teichoic acids
MKLELSDGKVIKEFSEEFKRKFNKLDILINNAGIL